MRPSTARARCARALEDSLRRLGVEAIDKLFAQHDKSQPLCLVVAAHSPHTIWPQVEGYEPKSLKMPPYFVDTPRTRQARARFAGLPVVVADARYFQELSRNVFRFLPVRLTSQDLRRMHGTNERLAIRYYERAIRLYRQLIVNTTAGAAPR